MENIDGQSWSKNAVVEALTIDEVMMNFDFHLGEKPPEHFNEHNTTLIAFEIKRN